MLNRIKKYLTLLFLILFLVDLIYSFNIHYHTPIGGDLAEIVNPNPNKGSYYVLQHPFGLGEGKYQNPNRFFAHWTTLKYFKVVPLFLQQFFSPIESLYIAAAIAKTLIQLTFVILFSLLINNSKKLFSIEFALAVILIFPLFQSFGYNRYMGIIDQSIVYSFFYALPLCLTLVLFSPIFKKLFHASRVKISSAGKTLTLLLILYLSLNGPLIPAVFLLVSVLIIANLFNSHLKKSPNLSLPNQIKTFLIAIDRTLFFTLLICCLFSLYSLYIGTFNSQNIGGKVQLVERFQRLPTGLLNLIGGKLGLPILIGMLVINYQLLRTNVTKQAKKIKGLFIWISIFSIAYILLLPFGGYRLYRINIIRYDTAMPIILCLIFLFGLSSHYLIINLTKKSKVIYTLVTGTVLLIFTNADRLKEDKSLCEKNLLHELAACEEDQLILNCNCTLVEWNTFNDYAQSELNATFFYNLGITSKKVLYKQNCD